MSLTIVARPARVIMLGCIAKSSMFFSLTFRPAGGLRYSSVTPFCIIVSKLLYKYICRTRRGASLMNSISGAAARSRSAWYCVSVTHHITCVQTTRRTRVVSRFVYCMRKEMFQMYSYSIHIIQLVVIGFGYFSCLGFRLTIKS